MRFGFAVVAIRWFSDARRPSEARTDRNGVHTAPFELQWRQCVPRTKPLKSFEGDT